MYIKSLSLSLKTSDYPLRKLTRNIGNDITKMYPEVVYRGITANIPDTVSNVLATYFADIYTPQSNDRYDVENFLTISLEYGNIK